MKKLFFSEKRVIYADGASNGTPAGNEINVTPQTTAAVVPNVTPAQPIAAEAPKPATAPEAAKPIPGMPEAPKGPETPAVTPELAAKTTADVEEKGARFAKARGDNLTTLEKVELERLPSYSSPSSANK